MTYHRNRMGECVDCGRYSEYQGRGLCSRCYQRHRKAGTLVDFPRKTFARDELLEEWDLLRGEGYTRAQAAQRLGITKARLEKAIERSNRERVAA